MKGEKEKRHEPAVSDFGHETGCDGPTDGEDWPLLEREVKIVNARGLHARAAAQVVKTAQQFDAVITVMHEGQTVTATSIMDLLLLAAGPGSTIVIQASGPQAEEALEALAALVANRFGEEE